MKLRHYVLAGVLVFFAALLLHAPAATLYGWIARSPASLQVRGIEGTLLSGRAAQLLRGSQPLLSAVGWSLQPWNLLLARLSYRIQAGGAPLLLDGSASAGLGGLRLREVKGSGDLRALAAAAGQSFVPVSGQIGFDLQSLRLRDAWPAVAEGRIRIGALSWALGREPVLLGDYEAQISTEDADIVARVATLSGVLDAAGDARLKPDRSYELRLQLRPRPDAPPLVANLLQQLGAPDAQGHYLLRQSGQLAP